ncbi:IS110 family transposase [Sinomonas gamaensis]|uniref:IS110 family transposase n=1 Tax=Sinomonas gamaensis TaxID=2565624 RepID=UPI001486A462|nr:IS110 family transposase [Sinomonas gamaensis]
MVDTSGIAVWCGLDVGKEEHHACALAADGTRLFDKPLPQDEAKLREVFTSLQAHGTVLVVVDQPNTIGALAIAVARDCGCQVAYLPGLAMRKAARLLPGDAKTDARDAYVIATCALKMPDTLRAVDRDSEVLASLKVLSGYDDDLARECTRSINRLRSLLLQIHPALERVFAGTRLTNQLTLDLLVRYGGPTGLRKAGAAKVRAWARKTKHRGVDGLVDDVFAALEQQSVTVIGTEAVETVIPRVAASIKSLKAERAELASEVERLLDNFPLREVLISMPGVGTKTATTILLAIGDASAFPTAAHLAAYAGIAPVTRRSGKSIRGEHPARSGNKQLKNALFRSAWVASNCDPDSAAYYQRKRAEGKKHNAAVMCLARRRCDVIHAMLRNGTLYTPRTPRTVPTAA